MDQASSPTPVNEPTIVQPPVTQRSNKLQLKVLTALFVLAGLGLLGAYVYQTYSGKSELFNFKTSISPSRQEAGLPVLNEVVVTPTRILYYKNKQLFSSTIDGKDEIDLSSLKVGFVRGSYLYGSNVYPTRDGKKFFFIREHNLWSANTDGTKVERVTLNSDSVPSDQEYKIYIDQASPEGSRVVFYYEKVENFEGPVMKDNPNIKYGYYLYDEAQSVIRFLGDTDKYHSLGGTTPAQPIPLEFVKGAPTYEHYNSKNIYTLDLDILTIKKFTDKVLPMLMHQVKIYPLVNEILYSGIKWGVESTGDKGQSQIIAINYLTEERIDVSPVGVYSEYQSPLASPNFENIFYSRNMNSTNANLLYFIYNVKTHQTHQLVTSQPTFIRPVWVSDTTFLSETRTLTTGADKSSVYLFDVTTNSSQKILDGVDRFLDSSGYTY